MEKWKYRWLVIKTLQERSSQATLWGVGVYILMTGALMASTLTLHNSLLFTERNIILIGAHPLFLPIVINTILVSLYLAMLTLLYAARERDRGTLEVLMYGPVDEIGYVLGLFLAQIKIYLVSVVLTFVWLNLITWLMHLAFSIDIYVILFTSIMVAGVVVAFGLFTAISGGRTRTALVYFFLVVVLFLGLQIADQAISSLVLVSSLTVNDPLILIRNVLNQISLIIQWVSPYSQLNLVIDAVMQQAYGDYMLHLAVLIFQMALLLVAGILILRRKGARG